ncbi:MAG: hypothetical protein HY000_15850 [Planctomycetes bacterium]|nr:hypothetical protein [Planctomycetota bacterium]
MNSSIDELLDRVDEWKFKLHAKLQKMTPTERRAFWNQVHEDARKMGLHVVEPEKPAKRPAKRVRRTG